MKLIINVSRNNKLTSVTVESASDMTEFDILELVEHTIRTVANEDRLNEERGNEYKKAQD